MRGRCLRWVKLGRTPHEHMFSALPLELGHCSMQSVLRVCAMTGNNPQGMAEFSRCRRQRAIRRVLRSYLWNRL
jgi:hypothetical protein